jgi:hypothetical protein
MTCGVGASLLGARYEPEKGTGMPAELTYMTSTKNLPDILEKIKPAGTPPKFTKKFLKTLGLRVPTIEPSCVFSRRSGSFSADNTPTDRYNDFRNPEQSNAALAQGLREGWSDLFFG